MATSCIMHDLLYRMADNKTRLGKQAKQKLQGWSIPSRRATKGHAPSEGEAFMVIGTAPYKERPRQTQIQGNRAFAGTNKIKKKPTSSSHHQKYTPLPITSSSSADRSLSTIPQHHNRKITTPPTIICQSIITITNTNRCT